MKKYILLAVALIMSLTLGPVHRAQAQGQTNDADIAVSESMFTAMDEFQKAADNPDVSHEVVKQKLDVFVQKIDAVQSHEYTRGVSDEYYTAANETKKQLPALKTAAIDYTAAIGANDKQKIQSTAAAYAKAAEAYFASLDKVDMTISAANGYVDVIYPAALAVAGLVTFCSFIWVFREKSKKKSIQALRQKIAYVSLVPLVGTVITYGGFLWSQQTGGTYMITWGLVLFGFYFYVRAIMDYRAAIRGPRKPHEVN